MSIRNKILTAVLGLSLVAAMAPGIASAALSASQVSAIISLLQSFGADANTIANVQASLTGGTPTPYQTSGGVTIPAGFSFTRTMYVGATGLDVTYLKVILTEQGCFTASITNTGFGPLTQAGVKCFQAKYGINQVGAVGPITNAKLNSLLAGGIVPPGPQPTTGGISAALSSDTPASTGLVNNEATADLLHVNFVGTGTVTSVTLTRSGISDQNTLTNVYLFDGNTRLTDGYSFNVGGQMTMNGLSIAVNGTHTISVKADLSGTASSSSSIAVTVTSFTGNGVVTSSNVMGNMMSIVAGSIATTSLTGNTVTDANVNAGTTQYTFWSAPLQVNTRTVMLKTANFRMVGSAPSDALANIRMFVDGVDTGKVATVITISGSNYASFDFTSAPLSLATGSHTIDVRADVQKGTYRDVTMSLQQASDFMITDTQVGVNVAVGGTVPNQAGKISILKGSATVVVDPTFVPQTNISGGASNATIGKFKIHAYGEDVKISSLVVTPTLTTPTPAFAGLANLTLYFNGSQVGSQYNWATGTQTFQLGSQAIAPAGQDSTLEVRADLQTTGSVAYTAGTVGITLTTGASNAQGQSSLSTLNVPSATVSTNGLSIQSSNLVASKNSGYGAQTVSPNTTGVKIGSYIIQNQSTSEAVRLTSLNVTMALGASTSLTNFSALRTSDTTGAGATPVQPTGNDTFSVNDVLNPGVSIIVDVFANTGADANTNATVQTGLTVKSIGAVDNLPATYGPVTGQGILVNTGTLATPSVITSSTTAAQYIAAANGATNASQATFNFVSSNGASTITELKFSVTGTDATPSLTATNVCVGSVCAQPVAGTADLTGLSLAVPNGGSGLTQNVMVSYAPVGTGGVTPGSTSQLALTYVRYTSGGASPTPLTVSVTAPSLTMVGSKPTVTVATGGSTGMVLNTSTQVGQVTVTADPQGDIKVRTITFNLGYSGYTTNPSALTASIDIGTTPINLAVCTPSGTTQVVCALGTAYGGGTPDFAIGKGQSQQFNLFVTTTGGANTGTAKAQISSSVTSGGFVWDDTSTNGGAGSVGLSGSLIYNFPTNSYSVSQ